MYQQKGNYFMSNNVDSGVEFSKVNSDKALLAAKSNTGFPIYQKQ